MLVNQITEEEVKKVTYNNAKLWQIGLFSLNNAALNLYLAMMLYVSYYANSIAGFGVVLVSVLMTSMEIFDGITDPIAGFLLDRMEGKFGKFRPFMLIGNLLMGISCFLMFFTTHHLLKEIRLIYFIFLYAIFIIGFTLQTVVGKSGQTVITDNPEQRPISTYFDSLFIMASYGGTALYVSNYLVPKYKGFTNEKIYQVLAVTVIVLAFICTILAMIGIWNKDRKEFFGDINRQKQRIHLNEYWEIIRYNKPIRMLIIAACTDKFASTVYGHAAVGVMLFGIMMKDYSIAGLIGLVTAVPTLVIVTLGIRVAQRFGQRYALLVFTNLAILFQVMMTVLLAVGQVDHIHFSLKHINGITIAFFIIFVLLNGSKSITNNMVVPMIADCSDYEVYRSGKYVPGLMGALFSFVDKIFAALGTAFVGLVLILMGYGKELPQISDPLTVKIKWITIFLYCIVPILGWICSIVALKFYKLDKTTMLKIQKEKNHRRSVHGIKKKLKRH